MENTKSWQHKAWSTLAAATAINLTMGINYSWSVIKKTLVSDWHWTNVEASLPYTTYTVFYGCAIVFAGFLQDKLGPRKVAGIGALILGIGAVACSYARTPLTMMLSYGMVVALGFSMGYATTIPTSVRWFPARKKGLITGIVVGATGLAAVYISPLVHWLLTRHSISETFLLFGAGAVLVIAAATPFLRLPLDKPTGDAQKDMAACAAVTGEICWQEMLKTPIFYKLWGMFFLAASSGLMIIGHIASIAKTQANWENGFYLASLLAVFNTLGRFVSGVLSDRFDRITILKLVFFLQAVNLASFLNYTSPLLLAVGSAVTGYSYGACFTLFPLLTSDYFGMKNFGVNYGLMFTAWGWSGILGPLLAGWVVDATGSYFLAYGISAVLLGAAFIIAFFTKMSMPRAV